MIELAVALNIAFVTVEYVKSYTNAVCNQLFNFAQFLREAFDECRTLLVDDITLNSIHDSKINGNSIAGEIERVKIAKEKLSKEMNMELQNFSLKIGKVCQSKSISSVSLWLFLYGLTYLFCMGINSIVAEINIEFYIICLTLFTIVYTVLGWSVGEKGYKMRLLDFTSLRHSIVSFAVAVGISLVLTMFRWFHAIPERVFSVVLIVSVLYMYSNFVVSSIIVCERASKVKKEIKDNTDNFKIKCGKLKDDVDKLLAVNALELKIERDNGTIETSSMNVGIQVNSTKKKYARRLRNI